MRRDVTSSTCSTISMPVARTYSTLTGIPVLKPSATNLFVLFVDDMLDILHALLDVIGVHDACDTSTDRENFDLSCVRAVKHDVRNFIFAPGNLIICITVCALEAGEGVDVGCHCSVTSLSVLVWL